MRHVNATVMDAIILQCDRCKINIGTVNGERFTGLNICIFTVFKSILQKFSREFKCLSLIILNNKHFWPRQYENISAKTSMGLKKQTFSPVNLSPSMVKYLCRLYVKAHPVIGYSSELKLRV